MRWLELPGTPARYRFRRVVREGVRILCVELDGTTENTPEGVSNVTEGLDQIASTLEPDVEVSTLDVSRFANASDDACGILTGVFEGVPCCWITPYWDAQRGYDRWDLPAAERMAPTAELAQQRVISWRRAGACVEAACTRRWTTRGVEVSHADMVDVFHRNRCVERRIGANVRVLWPRPDATGSVHEALQLGARVVLRNGEAEEIDFTPWSTAALPEDWLERVAAFPTVQSIDLRGRNLTDGDVRRAFERLPELQRVELDGRRVTSSETATR